MILVDTSVWIDFLNGAGTCHRRLLHQLLENDEDLCLTGIVLTEILQGIKEEEDFKTVQETLLAFPLYQPQGTETYLKAADIYRQCRKQGKTVRKTVDCIIAAVCLENNLTLLHKDSDFTRIQSCLPLKCLAVE